jgi:hypothetical protein
VAYPLGWHSEQGNVRLVWGPPVSGCVNVVLAKATVGEWQLAQSVA